MEVEMLAGPLDYTPGGFENVTRAQFQARGRFPRVLATRAHETALFVVFESPIPIAITIPIPTGWHAGVS